MEFLTDPVMMSFFGKLVAGVVIFFLVVGFVPGIIIGWLLGKST